MRPPFRFLITVLLALGWTRLATAESPTAIQAPTAVPVLTDLCLDTAFELATSPETDQAAAGVPTMMHCQAGAAAGEHEICIVTIDGLFASMPAAMPASLATH